MKLPSRFTFVLLLPLVLDTRGIELAKSAASDATAARRQGQIREKTAADVVRMQQAGVGNEVLLAFVRNTRVPYTVSAEDLLFLHENKVPEEVIAEWIKRSGALMDAYAQASRSVN